MSLSKTTRDHEEIQKWAEARGAVPAEVASTQQGKEPGILRFEFPHAPHRNDDKLQQISWEDFFRKFDENDLELVYQDVTSEGAQSNFNKFVHPDSEEHSGKKGAKHSSAAKESGSSHGKSSGKKGSSTAKRSTAAKKTSKRDVA